MYGSNQSTEFKEVYPVLQKSVFLRKSLNTISSTKGLEKSAEKDLICNPATSCDLENTCS